MLTHFFHVLLSIVTDYFSVVGFKNSTMDCILQSSELDRSIIYSDSETRANGSDRKILIVKGYTLIVHVTKVEQALRVPHVSLVVSYTGINLYKWGLLTQH